MCEAAEPAGGRRAASHKHTEMSQLAVNRPLSLPPRRSGSLNTDMVTSATHHDLQNKSPTSQRSERLVDTCHTPVYPAVISVNGNVSFSPFVRLKAISALLMLPEHLERIKLLTALCSPHVPRDRWSFSPLFSPKSFIWIVLMNCVIFTLPARLNVFASPSLPACIDCFSDRKCAGAVWRWKEQI